MCCGKPARPVRSKPVKKAPKKAVVSKKSSNSSITNQKCKWCDLRVYTVYTSNMERLQCSKCGLQ